MAINKNQRCTIVVPIYKDSLTLHEYISLKRCFDVFRDKPITIISPHSLNLNSIGLLENQLFDSISFEDGCFVSTSSYNKLMLDPVFYDSFESFEYILIYQLDAFVFSDSLSKWCDFGYDYIGAPWIGLDIIDDYNIQGLFPFWFRAKRKLFNSMKYTVGNGGFSLRKTSTFRKVLSEYEHYSVSWKAQEDVFWSCLAPSLYTKFRIPSADVAVKFSFEDNPRRCYINNNNELPFGCHAWARYDISFWRPIFSDLGYSV